MIPVLISKSNISRDFSLQLSKCLADSDLVVIGLTGIGPMRKIFVLDWFLPYWPNESFFYCIGIFDYITANKSKLINNVQYCYACINKIYGEIYYMIIHFSYQSETPISA
jgi:hypothetical protein